MSTTHTLAGEGEIDYDDDFKKKNEEKFLPFNMVFSSVKFTRRNKSQLFGNHQEVNVKREATHIRTPVASV